MKKFEIFNKKQEWRTPYFFDMTVHPDCPATVGLYDGRTQEPHACCPICGTKYDRHDLCEKDVPFDDEDTKHDVFCDNCENTFQIQYSFGYGITSELKECEYGHNSIFVAQYEYIGEFCRLRKCIDCGKTTGYKNEPFQLNVNPEINPEVNDVDFWDPKGVLKAPDGFEIKPTPLLDELRARAAFLEWNPDGLNSDHWNARLHRALDENERIYEKKV
jgi:hypothetical protein